LALARAIGKANLTFESQVTLAWFAGEEQGLFGSHAYAAKLKLEKREVALQIQADMLAYHVVSLLACLFKMDTDREARRDTSTCTS
jgi:Zn-dependent M28 family amino/carboxypeptidase